MELEMWVANEEFLPDFVPYFVQSTSTSCRVGQQGPYILHIIFTHITLGFIPDWQCHWHAAGCKEAGQPPPSPMLRLPQFLAPAPALPSPDF